VTSRWKCHPGSGATLEQSRPSGSRNVGHGQNGTSIEVSGIDIFRFRDDKVIEHWHEADHLEMFRQLGADVTPTTTP